MSGEPCATGVSQLAPRISRGLHSNEQSFTRRVPSIRPLGLPAPAFLPDWPSGGPVLLGSGLAIGLTGLCIVLEGAAAG